MLKLLFALMTIQTDIRLDYLDTLMPRYYSNFYLLRRSPFSSFKCCIRFR